MLVVVASNDKDVQVVLDCPEDQIRIAVDDFVLKTANPGIHAERKGLYAQLAL